MASSKGQAIAFDVYGTLIDTHGLVEELQILIGDSAASFSQTWRDKQLEYSFRYGLMRQYPGFDVCIEHALEYACLFHKANLSDAKKSNLIAKYKRLPAFADVPQGLQQIQTAGHQMFAFSNGKPASVEELLCTAKIREYFEDVISVDAIQTFKPNPEVYAHFLKSSQANADAAWLVSSNPFDIIGAACFGLKTAWIKRSSAAIFDPWGVEPTLTVKNLKALAEKITGE